MVTADQASPLDLSRPVSRATPPPPPKLRPCSPSDGARRRSRSRSGSGSLSGGSLSGGSLSGGSLSPVSSLSVTPGPSEEEEAGKQHFTTKRFLHKYRAEQSRGENTHHPESLVNNKDLISYGKNNPPILYLELDKNTKLKLVTCFKIDEYTLILRGRENQTVVVCCSMLLNEWIYLLST